ncbi:MAG: Ger(x)C family spore germination protein [Dehalobacterium sp.]
MNRIIAFFCLLVLFCFTGTGCWDLKDVSETAFVTGIALDLADSEDNPRYKVTLAIPSPLAIKNRSTAEYTDFFTAEAESITKALQKLQAELPRSLSFHHLRAVFFGEKLASNHDFRDSFSYFSKNPEIALRMRIFFIQGEEAQDFLKNRPQFERSIIGELVSLTQSGKQLALTRTNRYANFSWDLQNNEGTALGSRVMSSKDAEKKKTIRDGGAVFKDWKLIGWLSGEETQGANWLLDRPVFYVEGKIKGGLYTYLTDNKTVKINPIKIGDQIQFNVELKTNGLVIEEKEVDIDFSNPKNISELESVLSQEIKKQLEDAVYKSQKVFAADYLGFGKAFKDKYPKDFKKIEDWNRVYPEVLIHVKVTAKISRFGKAE